MGKASIRVQVRRAKSGSFVKLVGFRNLVRRTPDCTGSPEILAWTWRRHVTWLCRNSLVR